jgi:hypothetical protein
MVLSSAQRCRRKFLRYFPGGFSDATYLAWERDYKEEAHRRWQEQLGQPTFQTLLTDKAWNEIVARAIRIEARTNLLFSFEKMALRDAVKAPPDAQRLAEGLYRFLHGSGDDEDRFADWCATIDALPRRGTRVLTWPVVTVFAFLAQPGRHVFLKPNVTRAAAARYGYALEYASRPQWRVYKGLLDFAALLRRDLRDLHPRDMIDLQSFIWVQGSAEYAGRTFTPALTTRVVHLHSGDNHQGQSRTVEHVGLQRQVTGRDGLD